MKKISILLLAAVTFFACSKDDDKKVDPPTCATCITTPEAAEQYNQSSAGVYKGVLVGSSGTIALYLYNTGTTVTALVSFDGQSGTLSTTELSSWSPGQAINNALFTGNINGQAIQAHFSVSADGQNPVVTVDIPGHDVVVAIYKETSTSLIKSFQGTYTGDDNGIFNMVFNGDDFSLISDGGGDPKQSTLVNGKININDGGVEVKGEFQGTDYISGTWEDHNNNKSGTWSGQRTL